MALIDTAVSEGQSIWLDAIDRTWFASDRFSDLIARLRITGLTSNPSIFADAVRAGSAYDEQLKLLQPSGLSPRNLAEELMTSDIRAACDGLREVFDRTGGRDGFVSVEVSPSLANDLHGMCAEARRWVDRIQRENLLVKVPGTTAGLAATEELISQGVSVNITLLFSVERYVAAARAYERGLQALREGGGDLSSVSSVASFFVSRVDGVIDAELARQAADGHLDANEYRRLQGLAGIASALLALEQFNDLTATTSWRTLERDGAVPQRPLWASTGVKDASYPPTKYVSALIAPGTVTTIPLATLEAAAIGDDLPSHRRMTVAEAKDVVVALERLGISFKDVARRLEDDGVRRFVASEEALLDEVARRAQILAA